VKDFLDKILAEKRIEFYGFCDFKYFENSLFDCRAKSRLPKDSKTIITFVFPYKIKEEKPKNISRYAAVDDYHFVAGKILNEITDLLKEKFNENCFEWFIDNSPIDEVKAAVFSGLGVKGKNNLLINKKYGSFCFIGEIVTDYKIQNVNILNTECINCGLCLEACPTKFLKDKNNKCLSQITQQKAELNHYEKELIKKTGTIWGCDICQNVCPMNKNSSLTNIKKFIDSYKEKYEENEDITNRAYAWRGKKVIKRNFEILNEK
jgi:epoxyqueuosine reductase QueG